MYKGVFTVVKKGNLSKALKILKHPKTTTNSISDSAIELIGKSLDNGSYLLIEQINQSDGYLQTYWDLFDEDGAFEMYNYPEEYSIKVSPDECLEALNELLGV